MSRKIVNIQALRGVAALMVLLPHLRQYDLRFGGNQLPAGGIWDLGNAGVDLFFVISGFVMVTTAMGRGDAPAEPGRFLYRRAARIYPLYWFFSLIVLVVYLKNSAMVNAHDAGQKINLWKSFLLLPQSVAPLVAQGWTLSHELYFYLIFALVLMLRRAWAPVALLAWGAIVTVASFPLVQKNPELNVLVNPLTLEFIAGCFVALLLQRWHVPLGGWVLAGGLALLLAAGLRLTDLHSPWQRVSLYGVPAAVIVMGAVTVERAGKTAPRWLIATGDASYSLYLSHGLVVAALARFAWEKKHVPSGHVINLLVVAAMAAAAVAFAFVSYRFVERPLIAVTRKWFDTGKSRSASTDQTAVLTSRAS